MIFSSERNRMITELSLREDQDLAEDIKRQIALRYRL